METIFLFIVEVHLCQYVFDIDQICEVFTSEKKRLPTATGIYKIEN